MKEVEKMEPRKGNEELLKGIGEKNKILGIEKLKNDENGILLLDPSNSNHVSWFENDDEYEMIEEEKV